MLTLQILLLYIVAYASLPVALIVWEPDYISNYPILLSLDIWLSILQLIIWRIWFGNTSALQRDDESLYLYGPLCADISAHIGFAVIMLILDVNYPLVFLLLAASALTVDAISMWVLRRRPGHKLWY